MNLILTVGAGTGDNPTVDSALWWAIETNKPEKLFLVHSAAEGSLRNAQALGGMAGEIGMETELHPLNDPDNLMECVETIKRLAEKAPQVTKINGFSGTKTMSAAAAIAAIEAECKELQFTTGDREKGTVKSGTERLETINPGKVFELRETSIAGRLAQDGAYKNAASLFERHGLDEEGDVCKCLLHWENEEFSQAFGVASRSEILRSFRDRLRRLQEAQLLYASKQLTAELLLTASINLARGQIGEAYMRMGAAIEQSHKTKLEEMLGKRGPFTHEDIPEAPRETKQEGDYLNPDRAQIRKILEWGRIETPRILSGIYQRRSERIHLMGVRPSGLERAEKDLTTLKTTLGEWAGVRQAPRRPRLPNQ